MRFPGRGRTTAVAMHDGFMWRAYIARRERGEWTCTGSTEAASRSSQQIPKAVLDFIAQSRAKRLRVVLSGDVHVFTAAMPEDASNEELQTALAYEAQGEVGLEAAGHRWAAARADRYEMGGDRKALLAAGFETETLQKFADDAEREGFRFDSVGSLELAVLSAHVQRTPHRRLLLIRARTSFYAVPTTDLQPFTVAMLPLGLDMDMEPTARERATRASERLRRHETTPLTVVVVGDRDFQREKVLPYFGDCQDVTFVDVSELETAIIPTVAAASIGGFTTACAWVGLPPRPRDPHLHGTVILLMTVAITLSWFGLRKHALDSDLCAAQANLAAWETLEGVRKKTAGESKTLRDRQDTLVAKQALLEGRQCLPYGLLPLLRTLADSMPAYSCLVSIQQHTGGGFKITGLTHWQDGLPQLDAALREMGLQEGLRREFGGLETSEGATAQRFYFSVLPGEERR